MPTLSSDACSAGLVFDGVSPPTEVLQHLIAKFTEGQEESKKKHRVMLSERMKDKIFLHLLVLCLFVDDFNVEFVPLQIDLKVSKSKYVCVCVCVCVGCTTMWGSVWDYITKD